MSDIKEWDVAADSNTSSPPDGAPENMAAQTFNNTIREIMAAVKRRFDMLYALPLTEWDTGETSQHYQVDIAETVTAYYDGSWTSLSTPRRA